MAVVFEKNDGWCSLYIDGDLQFDSRDEKIYHEGLVLPALALAERRLGRDLRCLVIGGGDGFSARELLKSTAVQQIDLVDYDADVLHLGKTEIAELNGSSLNDERVRVHIEDAWDFVEERMESEEKFDLIVCDLTVPQEPEEVAFHSIEWYEMLRAVLSDRGVIAVNSASPTATPRAYWSIFHSILSSDLKPLPYHVVIPSFYAHGYGSDWGFFVASPTTILASEFDDELPLLDSRTVIKDADHVRRLFVFAQEVADKRLEGRPAAEDSEILLHYFFNDEPITHLSDSEWDALTVDLSLLMIPPPECGKYLLSPEIREVLSAEEPAADLFARVIELVPALKRAHTRELIKSFLHKPAAFLDAIDLPGLVARLLRRAAELPQRVVTELKLLKEKLMQWTGNYADLFAAGSRVLTIVTVVVILGNLIYPDVAFGKDDGGGGRGGGGHGDHGGGGHGDHGGDRGDHGDRGDRGFGDRGGRGWGGRGWGDGYGHHWDNFGHWGGYHDWHSWHHWGGWARPWHSYAWGGWGGYSVPFYAGGSGYLNLNFGGGSNNNNNNNNSTNNYSNYSGDGQSVDAQGTSYPARQYQFQKNIQSYDDDQSPGNSGDDSGNGSAVKVEGDYRLGPDTDILPGGKVALQLTDKAYLMMTADGTQVMDQTTGKSVMTLANDPSLVYHIASELKSQSLGLQSAAQGRQSTLNWSGKLGFQNQDSEGQQEVGNIQGTAQLLSQALQNLGTVPDAAPAPTPPPVEGAVELFASVWVTQDGNYLILKRPNGTLTYVGAKEWYSDQGKTKLRTPYPAQFKSVAVAYLQTLQKEASAEQSSLQQEQQEASDRLQKLRQRFQDMQPSQANSGGGNSGVGYGSGTFGTSGGDDDGGANPEAIRRLRMAIKRTQNRLNAVQNELNGMPQELSAITKALAVFQS